MKIENLQQLKEIIINEIKPYIIDKGKTPWQFDNNKYLFKQLNKKYNNYFQVIMELVFLSRNYNNLENLHIFCYCGNKNNFLNSHYGYSQYCCILCRSKDKKYQEKLHLSRLTNIDENGLNSYQRQTNKYIQTCLNKYGVKYILQLKNTRNKIKQTFLERYNGTSSFNSKILREKAANTRLKKYNNKNYNNREQFKQTSLKNWGTSHPAKNIKIKNKIKNTSLTNIDENGLNSYQRGIIKQKQTCLEKYNVNSYLATQQLRNYIKEHNDEIQQKMYQTKKKNNSFKISKKEEECYQLLLQKYNKDDIERQYRSELYPFNCDFILNL